MIFAAGIMVEESDWTDSKAVAITALEISVFTPIKLVEVKNILPPRRHW